MNFKPSKSLSNEVHLERGAKHCMTQKDEAVMFRHILDSLPTLARPGDQTMSLESTAVRKDTRNSDQCHPAQWLSRKWSAWCAASVTAAFLFSGTKVSAQEPVPEMGAANSQYTLPYSDISGSAGEYSAYSGGGNNYSMAPEEPAVVGGSGVKGRVVHEAGQTIGRTQSITSFDLSPFTIVDNWIFFGEGRLAVGNNGKAAGSLGGGTRHYFPRLDSILGVTGWYDADASRGPTFQQWGLSGEAFSEFLDIRANYYEPFGETYKITGQQFEPGTQRFVDADSIGGAPPMGSNLVFQRRTFTATAMRGFDTLFSVPVPGKVAQNFNLEASAGFYNYFTQDDSVDDVWGWRIRFDADVAERLSHMFLEVTHDKTFKTNVVFGIDINYWGNLGHRDRLGHSQYGRLAEWVRRNRTVVAFEGSYLEDPERAVNPRTNQDYLFYQVNTEAVGSAQTGTQTDPFTDIQTAINAAGVDGADVVFVQGNSVLDNGSGITIDVPYLQVIGEQLNPTVELPVANLSSNVLLPSFTTGAFTTPTIRNVVDQPAVTLGATGVRFAAFNIEDVTFTPTLPGDPPDPTKSAIYANGVTFVSDSTSVLNSIDTVNINGVTNGNGLSLVDVSGRMLINNLSMGNIGEDMLYVDGGTVNLTFDGENNNFVNTPTVLSPTHGYAVRVTDFAGTMNLRPVVIDDTAGKGIRIEDTNAIAATPSITFGDVSLTATAPASGEGDIYVNNYGGNVNFLGNVNIDQLGGTASDGAIVVRNLRPTSTTNGTVQFSGSTTIDNRIGRGIYLTSTGAPAGTVKGNLIFNGPVNVNNQSRTATAAAVDLGSTRDRLQFGGALQISGGAGDGIYFHQDDADVGLGAEFLATRSIDISNIRRISFRVEDIASSDALVGLSVNSPLTITNRGAAGLPVDNSPVVPNDPAQYVGVGVLFSEFYGNAQLGGTVTVGNGLGSFADAVRIENNYIQDTSIHSISFLSGITANGVLGSATSDTVGVLVNNNGGAGVSLGTVNVSGNLADGVWLKDNSNVAISGGTINMTNGRGITVETTANGPPVPPATALFQTHQIVLGSVSATGADYGILVRDSQGSFSVIGNNSTGGTISGMTASVAEPNAGAAVFENNRMIDTATDFTKFNVSLTGMSLTGNVRGVSMTDVNGNVSSLILNQMTIGNSAGRGLYVDNVRSTSLFNSSLTSNGVTQQTEQIEVVARGGNVPNRYDVTMTGNNITDSFVATNRITNGRSMINIHTTNSASSEPLLFLTFEDNGTPDAAVSVNSVNSNRSGGASALLVNWNGDIDASIRNNTFVTQAGANQNGVTVNVDGGGTLTYSGNSMTTLGSTATGVSVVFSDTADIFVNNNGSIDAAGNTLVGFAMSGLASTAIDITALGTDSRIEVANNLIQYGPGAYGGIGVQFSQLFGTNGDTNVFVSGNTIQLSGLPANNGNNVASREIGFNFVNIRGRISLSSVEDNVVTTSGSTFYFYDVQGLTNAPVNGTIQVNGTDR